ncbi:uncharacterized protein LOC127864618 isoform X10 [Dreissena polymorpha]|uniref:uncharacterized protein LOC127864618 isoform X10 n=1 Tax=Dreissena polymorpha TaxID=45954 RepID=UPI0022649AFB|nr:uncharacterized protein LOC127864618 isoform X10 [Dreissena polymorpha]
MQGFMVSSSQEGSCPLYSYARFHSPVRKEAVHFTVMQGFMVSQSSQEGSCPLYSYARFHGAVQSGRKLSTIQLCKVSWSQSSQEGSCPLYSYARFQGLSPVRKEAVHYTVMQGFMVSVQSGRKLSTIQLCKVSWCSPVGKEAVHYTVMQGVMVQSSQEGSCPLYSYARFHGAVQSGRKLSTIQLCKVSWCSPVRKEAVHYTVMQGFMVQSSQEGSCPLYSYARFHGLSPVKKEAVHYTVMQGFMASVQSGRKLSTIQLCKVSWSQSSQEGSCPLYSYARCHGAVQSGRKLSTIQLCKVSWCSPVRKEAVHYTVMQGFMVSSSQEGSCPLYSYARFHGLTVQSGRKLSTIQLCKVSWCSPVRKEAVHYTVMQGFMVSSSQEGSCPLYSYARFHGLTVQSGRKLSTIQLCKVSWCSPVRKEAVHYTVMQGFMVSSSQEGSCPLYSYARFHGLISK